MGGRRFTDTVNVYGTFPSARVAIQNCSVSTRIDTHIYRKSFRGCKPMFREIEVNVLCWMLY